ncbi:MAG: gamma-glutamyltransferase [Bradyrhizobiaceae bacterium]|nr:gamma-glutamyltransferase [Bradyrhizobiaceae bacterium]
MRVQLRVFVNRAAAGLLVLLLAANASQAQTSAIAHARNGMVASEEARATRIGVEILKQGGNAVDAAVAVGFALAVTLPESGNLGGGGFMVIRLAGGDRAIAIDYRETAPASATRDMFLNEKGEADPLKSRFTGLAVGVPGTVAGLAYAHHRYGSGKFTLAQLIAPAIPLARDGFEIDARLAASLAQAQPRLARHPSAVAIFLKPDGSVPGIGDRLVQKDLAQTLEEVAQQGPFAFYEGPIADRIAAQVRLVGGHMTGRDLADYRAREREPVRGNYRGYDVISMPPPSSGGVHLVQMLNILEGYDLRALGQNSPAALHLLIEAMKLAFADRAEFLGDPDFLKVPVKGLASKRYAAALREGIDRERARSAAEIRPGKPAVFEPDHTTHFSVVDRDGNAVANTYTLNFFYGVGMVAEGTGVLLNNELDDFAAAPDAPNAYGLTGGDANAPGPRKRPLSSMTPTIVLRDGKPFFVTGAAGGSRIITAVLQAIVNAVDFGMDVGAAVSAPRVHHQWLPDEAGAEIGIAPEVADALKERRHVVREGRSGRAVNSIMATADGWAGAIDPRSGGLAEGY